MLSGHQSICFTCKVDSGRQSWEVLCVWVSVGYAGVWAVQPSMLELRNFNFCILTQSINWSEKLIQEFNYHLWRAVCRWKIKIYKRVKPQRLQLAERINFNVLGKEQTLIIHSTKIWDFEYAHAYLELDNSLSQLNNGWIFYYFFCL